MNRFSSSNTSLPTKKTALLYFRWISSQRSSTTVERVDVDGMDGLGVEAEIVGQPDVLLELLGDVALQVLDLLGALEALPVDDPDGDEDEVLEVVREDAVDVEERVDAQPAEVPHEEDGRRRRLVPGRGRVLPGHLLDLGHDGVEALHHVLDLVVVPPDEDAHDDERQA